MKKQNSSFSFSSLIKANKSVDLNTLLLIFPFFAMDVCVRILSVGVNYRHPLAYLPSALFSIFWVTVFVYIIKSFNKTVGRILYTLIFLFFFTVFFAHVVYYPYTGYFFSFSLIKSASEGKSYIWSTIKNSGAITYLLSIPILVFGIVAIVKFPSPQKRRAKKAVVSLLLFFAAHMIIPHLYGFANRSLEWDTWRNPKNIYSSFSDTNKCVKICGLYEYTVRDFYVNCIKPRPKDDPEEVEFLQEAYKEEAPFVTNEYTGIFEDKNVIILQLEGIDTWLLNKKDMPNLYEMMDSSIVFDDHYSFYTGGGSTFNSELAINTGFLNPFSFSENAYSFHQNLFPHSLPKMLESKGYVSNCFHMNSGEFYSRKINYENWGYENYFGLIDVEKYKDSSYMLDRELILNETFYENMFEGTEPFLNYLITYTVHTPFEDDNNINQLLAQANEADPLILSEMNEEEYARYYAAETDYMVGLLLEALKDNGLYDSTIIVAVSDHYLYTLNDKTILDKYKNTDNNLINQTPFFIWCNGIDRQHIDKTNSQIDVLPTLLNMLGIEYSDDYYIGRDIMDEDYTGYVFFSDYSWYDGENYVELGEVVSNTSPDESYIAEVNETIKNKIQKNDLTLKYDHFRKLHEDPNIHLSPEIRNKKEE